MSFYNAIDKEGSAEFRDRGSKFIAHAFPFADKGLLKEKIARLKKTHPKAAHFCFAYRIGTNGNNFRSSDDGEPAGTAGKPILGQLDSKEITNTLMVVVRYFGGTLLGVSGLINAYRTASSMALQVVPIMRKPVLAYFNIRFEYSQINELMMLLKQYSCTIDSPKNPLFPELTAGIPVGRQEELVFKLNLLANVELSPLLQLI